MEAIADLSALDKPVAIIIPFYNDPCLEECLERLFKYTPGTARVIIVDDCSPLPAEQILAKFGQNSRVTIIKNQVNLRFSGAVNRGMMAAGKDDVILLNSDARVTPGWLRSILLCAASQPRVATVTPMSDRAGAFSAPERGNVNQLPSCCSEAEYARAFFRASFGLRPSVPSGHGFCMYISRACINEIGMIDEETFNAYYGDENDFCMRALRAGWQHLIDDRAYVFHERATSFSPEREELMRRGVGIVEERYPEYRNAISVFRQGKRINFARFAGRVAAHNCLDLAQPRILFVMAVSDGGTPQTNLDLMREFQDNAQCYLLECDTRMMRLRKLENRKLKPVFEHCLKEQLEPISHLSAEYDAVAAGWLFVLDIDIVHIRQQMWHSLNLITVAKKLGCKVIYSFHDFYALNPNLNLIDDTGVFRGSDYVEQASPYRINIWQRSGRGVLPVHEESFRNFWKKRFLRYLLACDAYVTTSEQTRAIILEELPELEASRFFVIPHGRNFKEMVNCKAYLKPWQPIKLLVPGNIDFHKGQGLIEALAAYDQKHADRLSFHILGRWRGPRMAKIIPHGEYAREDFGRHVAAIAPHAGLVFSLWSETWCHTLTELWACGLPALVLDFGTQAERVRRNQAGWVLPDLDLPKIYEGILHFLDDPGEMRRVESGLADWQATGGMANNTRLMAARYYDIYANLLAGWPRKAWCKRKIVAVCTKEGLGTSHVRVIEPCRNDFKRAVTYLFCSGWQLRAYAALGWIDGAIIQRNLLGKALVEETVAALQKSQIPYNYELDDDLFQIPPDKDPELWYQSYKPYMQCMMRHARHITVSTEELAKRYGQQYPGVVCLQSKLRRRLWGRAPAKRHPDSFVRALYYGTPGHKEDLLFILPALKEAARQFPQFRLALLWVNEEMREIVAANPFIEALPFASEHRPYPAFAKYLRKLAPMIDFGLAPLLSSHFNAGKSFIKVIEYAALGMPAIASNVIPYNELVDFPHLLLADNEPDSWLQVLEQKIERDRENRQDGLEAFHYVKENFMIDAEYHKQYDNLLF